MTSLLGLACDSWRGTPSRSIVNFQKAERATLMRRYRHLWARWGIIMSEQPKKGIMGKPFSKISFLSEIAEDLPHPQQQSETYTKLYTY